MEGEIIKKDNSWFVKYQDYIGWGLVDLRGIYFPIHPDTLKYINELEQVFDNIEARIFSNPKVEFELEIIYEEDGNKTSYAKIKKL